MKKILKVVAGIILITGLASGCSMKSLMVQERVSPYGVEDTVKKIQANAKAIGWVSPGVKNMNKSIAKHGGNDIGGQVRIVELCNAQHASKILSKDEGRYSALLMPCAIAVYEKSDGNTYVSNMRAKDMGSMMGGVVSEVMADVDIDQQKILEFLPK
ncbi:MAG: DUF302 domain-containing protein [Gammaproteobacteria bacterium]|nr:DUF302 domain-containing protein [Gammaproteobacteria bacterium]